MNILRLNAYFKPEITAASHLMNDLYEGFSKNKIKCSVITPEPTRGISEEIRKKYKEKRNENLLNGYLEVERFSMIREGKNPIQRALRYLMCSVMHYYKGIQKKNIDVVFSGSTPPTNGMISVLVARKLSKRYKRKVRFIYELQDIFPDSLVNAKLTHEGSLIWKIGRKIEQFTYFYADNIIVPTMEMKKNLIEKNVDPEKISVVSNWIDCSKVKPIKKEDNFLYDELGISKNDFIVLYAGNLGEAQGADIIIKVAEKLKEYKNIKFVIFGGGVYFQEIKSQAEKIGNVIVKNLLPTEYVSFVYSLGDVALITCKKGTGKAAMPSKTWSIMACNTPIIASFDVNSELANVINKSSAGECIEPENVEKLKKTIIKYYEIKRKAIYKNLSCGRNYVEKHASKEVCVEKYVEIVMNINKRED